MTYSRIAESLTQHLNLSRVPIGLAFLDVPPPNVRRYADAVPSACAFWKAAERGSFFATAEDHYNCPIGAMTHGFPLPSVVSEQAMGLIEQMGKIAYFEAAEANHVPMVRKPHQVVVYGPLKEFAEQPDVALIVCAPLNAMLLAEAGGIVAWEESLAGPVLGRPACAAIPAALERGATTVSLGCMGARTFAGIEASEVLVVLPGAELPLIADRLGVIQNANASMRTYYEGRKSQFATG